MLDGQLVKAQSKLPDGLELEVDPFAYFLKGYSLHLGYSIPFLRFSLGVFGVQQPDFVLKNPDLNVFTSGLDLKTDFLPQKIKGFLWGVQSTYSTDVISLKAGRLRVKHSGINIGVRGGYRFMLGQVSKDYNGLYIVPWIALLYSPDATKIPLGGTLYHQPKLFLFPTIHAGWRF